MGHRPAQVGRPGVEPAWAGRVGPVHQRFIRWASARPGPTNLQVSEDGQTPGLARHTLKIPGPVRSMSLASRLMRHGVDMGWPDNLTGRPTDRSMLVVPYYCKRWTNIRTALKCFVFCFVAPFKVPWANSFQSRICTYPLPSQVFLNQRPAPMASVLTINSGPRRPLLLQHLPLQYPQLQHLLSICNLNLNRANITPVIVWWGSSHATGAVLMPGPATTHTKENVAATFFQKTYPAWAYFTKL